MAGFFKEPDRQQIYLLPVNMMEWVPEDDIAHLILDVLDGMDLSRFEGKYRVGGVGAPAMSPKMMLGVLIYGYSYGYKSSRKLERLCVRDAGFRMIVGEVTPDHATIARFRRKHYDDVQELFTEVLKLCRKAGLVRMGTLAVDGTKVKSHASLDANRTAPTIEEEETRLEEEVAKLLKEAEEEDAREDALYGEERGDKLPKELRQHQDRLQRLKACREEMQREASEKARQQQEKIDTRTAEEAKTGRKQRGRKPKPADDTVADDTKANVTDPDSRIMKTRKGWLQGYNAQAVVTEDQIIVAASVTQDRNDVKQLQPMMEQTRTNLVEVTGDEDVKLGVMLGDAGYWSEENAAAETEDCELLIATLKDHKQRKAMKDQKAPKGRIPNNLSTKERMERKLLTQRGKTLYKKRGQTVEPVFGQMKETQGGDTFSMRGLELCNSEWTFQSTVHNLKKLHSKCVQLGVKVGKWLQ
jgi:transposase